MKPGSEQKRSIPYVTRRGAIGRSVWGWRGGLAGLLGALGLLWLGGGPLPFSPSISLAATGPLCDIQMSQPSYGTGDTVTAQSLRVANTGSTSVPIEIKIWVEVPGLPPITFANLGADGSVPLPAGFNMDFGPLKLATVPPELPRGMYAFNCRILDPVTKQSLTEDLNPFAIR
ncbi:MAG: hypothetical protein HYZ81_23700 [Nitrospinae bacterium]|nr:hypothetical protein [Nitrospinota bacterium]